MLTRNRQKKDACLIIVAEFRIEMDIKEKHHEKK
jgi:hypothetical protein